MSILPPGLANATTALYAGTTCGNITQTDTYTTTSTVPLPIGFTTPATWSDTQSFTSADTFAWNCQKSGVYNLRFNQTIDVTAPAPPDSSITVIPNTTFFLDVSGTLTAPQIGSAILHPIATTQATITYSSTIIESDILMGTFTTTPGFLTSLATSGGVWTLSLFASTTNTEENNSAYISVYTVDADGSSNPVLVLNGAFGTPFLVNGDSIVNYISTFTVPTFIVDDLTKRVQFRIYANFSTDTASDMVFYFRDETLSAIETTISQDIVPLTLDTVDLRLTVISATSEFNQVFSSSIPINIGTILSRTYSSSVNVLANVLRGDQVRCTIVAVDGLVGVSSGETTFPTPANTLQWNLLAEGIYGNPDIIAAPEMAVENFGIQDR